MSGQHELYAIKRELLSIIDEIDSIAAGINKDFVGIGNEKCTSRLNKIANNYRNVKYKLDRIDTSKLSEQFAKK
ncbi:MULTISPECIES: hypothetical protein [Sutcliffiella]|uniref:hypothetical protein n=1 Tax=Sutcliffiella TaxID=2837511 RepID=UPI0022DDD7C8|nr:MULTISPECIES: hypothetical protein [Sutcliffiella]MED4014539.1 hypothetical protein [Sutcliffiella cohnii]WBL14608.1 hypothetical protein O1A01_22480 [Sutcliffiella sp. NC1]